MPQFGFNYLGDCYHIAIALSKKFNLPICVLYGERWTKDPLEKVMIHVGVLCRGAFFDETGMQGTPEDVLKMFQEHNEIYDKVKIYEFDSPSDPQFLFLINDCGGVLKEDRILYFSEWLEFHHEKFSLLF